MTFTVIIVMLLLVYRSIVTVLLMLVMVVLELAAARGVVAFLGYHEIIGLSTFATNLLVTAGDRRRHGLRHLPDRPISGSAGVSARTENRRTTPCSAAPPTWCWARA